MFLLLQKNILHKKLCNFFLLRTMVFINYENFVELSMTLTFQRIKIFLSTELQNYKAGQEWKVLFFCDLLVYNWPFLLPLRKGIEILFFWVQAFFYRSTKIDFLLAFLYVLLLFFLLQRYCYVPTRRLQSFSRRL